MSQNSEDFIDDFDKNTSELVKKLKNNRFAENSIICKNAADQIIQSANPEAKKIYTFLMGLSKFEAGKAEKDPGRAKCLFQESLAFWETENTDNEKNNELLEQAKILILKKEIEIHKGDNSKLAELFQTLASIEKERGRNNSYHEHMGTAHMFKAITQFHVNILNSFKELDESIKHFEITGKNEFIFKLRGMKYRLLSYFQPSLQQRLVLLNKQLDEIVKTSDRFGITDCKACISFLSARLEKKWQNKRKLFKESADLFRKDKNFPGYHVAKGYEFLWAIHNKSLGIDKSINLLKRSRDHFQKGNDPIGFNNACGQFYLLKAIKEGVIKKSEKKFVDNILKANHHYAKCNNSKYVNLTAGVLLFELAIKLPSDKAKETYKKAAEILQSINDAFSNLAYYSYYKLEAYSDLKEIDYSSECLQKAACYLEKWIDTQAVKISERAGKTKYQLFENINELIAFYRAETFYLKGISAKNKEEREKYLETAIEKYDETIKSGFLTVDALRAKGWAFMFLFMCDKAHSAFEEASRLEPGNKGIKSDLEFSLKQLKKGFQDIKILLKEEYNFSRKLMDRLSAKISHSQSLLGPNYTPEQDFFNLSLTYIQKAGLAIEENYPNHKNKDEEALRDELVQCLKMFNVNVSAEDKKAKGKRDIAIKDFESDKEFAAECLVWKGEKYYQTKKDQLFDRYLTWHNKQAALITFVRNRDFQSIIAKSQEAAKKLSGIIDDSFQDLSSEHSILFVSKHNHSSGTTILLFHIFFHLPNQ